MAEKRYTVRAGTLLDGSGGPALKNAVFSVEGRFFGPAGEPPGEAGEAWDLSACTVLPGLVDCHAHLLWSGTPDPRVRSGQVFPEKEWGFAAILKNCESLVRAGVAAVRDGGDPLAMVLSFLEENGAPPGLVVRSPGQALHAPGRYGKIIGIPMSGDRLAWEIFQNGRNRHHVKLVQSGLNSLDSFGRQTAPQYRMTDMRAAVQAAMGRKLPVMVHANGELPVAISVEAGAQSIEHGFFMGPDNLSRMAEKEITWVPTAVTMKGYAETLPQGSAKADTAGRILEHQVAAMAEGREKGVKMAAGTDSGSQGVFHGKALFQEMELFRRAGFSIPETVAAASSAGAQLLGLSDLGMVREGFRACFLAVPGGPEDIFSRPPCLVVADGRILHKEEGLGGDLFQER